MPPRADLVLVDTAGRLDLPRGRARDGQRPALGPAGPDRRDISTEFRAGIERAARRGRARAERRRSPGDVVVLYTDGITEAEDIHGEQYGLVRLCEVVRRAHARTAAELEQSIVDDATRFIGAQRVHDDITTVVSKRR